MSGGTLAADISDLFTFELRLNRSTRAPGAPRARNNKKTKKPSPASVYEGGDSAYNPNSEMLSALYTTPSSRIFPLTSISVKTKGFVQEVDPNQGRCLVENRAANLAIDFCHCFPRYPTGRETLVCDHYIHIIALIYLPQAY